MNKPTILITGGAGFIGSNFIPFYMLNNPNTKIVNLDLLTYAGNLENLSEVQDNTNYTFIKGDICDFAFLQELFNKYNFESVIHFAAESHVDNSINGPQIFIETNIKGTFNLLEIARKKWMKAPFEINKGYEKNRFHHISTDEVYGSLKEVGLFKETTPYAPNSPYSASKASSDFIVRAYFHTYGLNVVTTNCSNNYGPKQHVEKLIPITITKALKNEPIPIYGNGKNIRDWLYVLDHCKGIEVVFKTGRAGEVYNIGGKKELDNLSVVHTICAILDKKKPKADNTSYKNQICFVKDRPGHDLRYAIDASKIQKELHWEAVENFESGILKTINWYLKKEIQP